MNYITEQIIVLLCLFYRRSQPHWSSEQSLPSVTASSPGFEAQPVSHLHLLRKLSLLKLTALMDKYSPSSKQGWNW